MKETRHIVIDHYAKKAWPYTDKAEAEKKLRSLIAGDIERGWEHIDHPTEERDLKADEVDLIRSEQLDFISSNAFIAKEGEKGAWTGFDTAGRCAAGGSWPEDENRVMWDGFARFDTIGVKDGEEVAGVEE